MKSTLHRVCINGSLRASNLLWKRAYSTLEPLPTAHILTPEELTPLSEKKIELIQKPLADSVDTRTIVDNDYGVTLNCIEEAHERIRFLLKPTPIQYSPLLSQDIFGKEALPSKTNKSPRQIFLKYENKHMTGSFKERGAINKLALLSAEERSRGVVASSAGNHAQAVSYHAMRMGVDCTICMPETAPLSKINGTKRYGAKVVLVGNNLDDAYVEASRIMKEEGRTFVHPYNDFDVISGQGTLGLELMEQNPYLDTVICPVGGGGLIAGTALAIKSINPRIKVIGVEAEAMQGMIASKQAKKPVVVPFQTTIADGIAVKNVGEKTFKIIDKYVDDIVTVNDGEIAQAVLTLLEREKTMCEGAGATGIAAMLTNKINFTASQKRICVVLSGGNIDVGLLREIIDRGLVNDGRLARLRVVVPDVPGNLARVLTSLAEMRCNVREVEHERAFRNVPVGKTATIVTLQTRGWDHIDQVYKELTNMKFEFSFEGMPEHKYGVKE
ncbi:tdcB [Acrasis kona]|uniref:TdcB n=1 Tax=Acrasis kona TaxID=1008807 RepID=A0AAW2YW78_9EUKA